MSKKISISTSYNSSLVIKTHEQITEANGNIYPFEKLTIALYRCVKSENKPFCNGTHGKINWTDEKQDGSHPHKFDNYIGINITISDLATDNTTVTNFTDIKHILKT